MAAMGYRTTAWVLSAAAALRGLLVPMLWAQDPLLSSPVADASVYLEWASTGVDPLGPGAWWFPPLFPWLLGLFGGGLVAALVFNALLGLCTTAATMSLAHRLFDGKAAVAAGVFVTLYAPQIFWETRVMPTTLATTLTTCALLLALDPTPRRTTGAGLLAGLAALARPNLLLLIPCHALGLLAARRSKAALCLVLGAALPIGMSLGRNLAEDGSAALVTVNGGVNFSFAWADTAASSFLAPGPEWGDIRGQRAHTEETGAGWPLGLAWIADHPSGAFRLAALRIRALLGNQETGIVHHPAPEARAFPLWRVLCVPFLALMLCALPGIARVSRRHGWTLGVHALAIALPCVLFFFYSRFRLPLMPLVCALAGGGLYRWRAWLRPTTALAAAGLALVSLWTPEAVDRLDRSGSWLQIARVEREHGRPGAAAQACIEALALHHGHRGAEDLLFLHSVEMPAEVEPVLRAAVLPGIEHPAEATCRLALGLALLQKGDLGSISQARPILESLMEHPRHGPRAARAAQAAMDALEPGG